MRVPPHVLTKLYLAGAAGTVGAVVLLHPFQRTTSPPVVDVTVEEEAATPVEIDIVQTPPAVVVVPPKPQPQLKIKPKPPRRFANSCGHPVEIDPSKPTVLLKACGKG